MLSSWKFLLTLHNKSVYAITNIFLNSNDMNKRELTKNISNKTGISIKRINYVVQSLLEIIKTSIEDGESVSLQNFGTFKLCQRKARNFYNIATRNIDVLPKQKIVRFVPHKKFKGIYSVGNILTNVGTTHTLNCSTQITKIINRSQSKYNPQRASSSIVSNSPNIGQRRSENTSEFHDNIFEYIGTVGYDFYLGESEHTLFPMVKTPIKGTKILKWYKSHKDAIVGASEPLLVAEIDKLCKKYDGLVLLDKVAIPIKNREYSFRPDIALCWPQHNIYVDIEIDEPYDICSHKPTHYIGCSDNLRDKYFIRNGWCVVRYSENQILHHINEVTLHLEYVLNWLSRNSKRNYTLFEESRWSYDEAIQMAYSSQREKSIGVNETQPISIKINNIVSSPDVVFIKPDNDILPEQIEDCHYSAITTQLDYALGSKSPYLRITRDCGYQFILETKTAEKSLDEEDIYISGTDPICPSMSSTKHRLSTISKIEPISKLDTGIHWKQGAPESVEYILVNAATNGSPIWIKYKNSQGDISERFLSNVTLFLDSIKPLVAPLTDLGTIANPKRNWRFYILGFCSIRNEFRQFACDSRLMEVKVLNCKYNYIASDVYQNSLAELIMDANNYKLHFYESVDYLLKIMPECEKNSLLSKGNIANYEVFKGNLDGAFDTYTSTPQNDIIENCEGKTWMQVCINDIEQFINDYKDKSDSSYNYDIVPSKVVENFTKIKTMLIQAGWEWNI